MRFFKWSLPKKYRTHPKAVTRGEDPRTYTQGFDEGFRAGTDAAWQREWSRRSAAAKKGVATREQNRRPEQRDIHDRRMP